MFTVWARLHGFDQAKASWLRAWTIYEKTSGSPDTAEGPIDAEKAFFHCLRRDPKEALQSYPAVVTAAAERGDLSFLDKVENNRLKTARGSIRNSLSFVILHKRLHGFLWLIDSSAAVDYLDLIGCLERPLTSKQYLEACRRLKLVGWQSFYKQSPIVGYIDSGAFRYRMGVNKPGTNIVEPMDLQKACMLLLNDN